MKQQADGKEEVISGFEEMEVDKNDGEKGSEKGKEPEDSSGLEEMSLDGSGDEKGESEEQAREAASSSSSKKSSPSFFSSLLGNAKVEVQPEFQDIKLMVVGDEIDGLKTKLFEKYIEMFPQESIGEGSYGHNVRLNIVPEKTVVMHLWSTAGMEDKDHIRRASYADTNVFILLYSVTNKESYENIGRWVEEIKSLCCDAQYILVGCDNDDPAHSVTYEEGAQLAKEIGAAAFFECSIATGEGVKEIFDEAAIAAQITKSQMDALIKDLETYATKRAAKGYSRWDEFFGGKPGLLKVNAALGLVAKLKGEDPDRKFSQNEIEALETDTLGEKVTRLPIIVEMLKYKWRAEPAVAENERENAGNIQSSSSSSRGLSQ